MNAKETRIGCCQQHERIVISSLKHEFERRKAHQAIIQSQTHKNLPITTFPEVTRVKSEKV